MVTFVYRATLVGLVGAAAFLIGQEVHAEDPIFTLTSYALEDGGSPVNNDRPNFTQTCFCERQRFFFTAEALWLQLDHGTRDARPVASDICTKDPILTTHDLNYNTAAGPRLGFGWYLSPCSSIEASYFGLQHWDAGGNAESEKLLTQRLTLGDETVAASTANLNSAEVSYVRRISDSNLSVLTGFRYLNFGEKFEFARDFDLYYRQNEIGSLGYDQSRDVQNYLFGWQTGARYRTEYGRFGLGLTGKVGIYGNSFSSHRTTDLNILDCTIPIVDQTTRGTHAAFIGELGINGYYQITKCWNISTGYNLIWVDGIARAANQFNQGDWRCRDNPVAFGRGAFLHGANIGLNYNW